MDDDDVRRMLRKAVMKDEKEHRDVVGPAVEIVLRRRRRVRAYGAAGSGFAVAAGATAAIWVGGSPARPQPHPEPAGSSTATASHSHEASGVPSQWDKDHDIFYRLPGLLEPLLPNGLSLAKSTASLPNTDSTLNGPSGNNDFHLSASRLDRRNRAMEVGCVVGGVCSHRQVPGGTLYIQTKNFTADYGGNSGYAPGTGKQILTVDAEYEFVPTAADGYVVDISMSTAVSHEHYSAKPPTNWGSAPWPPPSQPGQTFNASGVLLSPDDFTTVIAKPGFGAVATLLDSSTPVDPSTLERHRAADATIAAAVKPVLPAGLTLAIATGEQIPYSDGLILTGPSGANEFSWTTNPQQKNWRHGWACEVHTQKGCTWKEVPGGEIQITTSPNGMQPMGQDPTLFAPGQADKPYAGGTTYEYLPDDPNGTIVEVSTGEQFRDIPWAATRPTSGAYADPRMTWPPPARNGEPFNAGGPLLSVDQFAAMVQTPGIAEVVQTVTAAQDPLRGAVMQIYG